MNRKRICSLLLAWALALALSACGGKATPPPIETSMATPTLTTTPNPWAQAEDSAEFRRVRQELASVGKAAAIAYLGYGDGDWRSRLKNDATLGLDWPFLRNLPDEAFVDAGGDEMYLFIPQAENTSVTVKRWILDETNGFEGEPGEVLYQSDAGHPFVLRCNVSDIMPNSQVVIASEDGSTLEYTPALSLQDGSVILPPGLADYTEYLDSVENSGGHYLRVGDKLYFRKYGPEACDTTALGGSFTSLGITGMASDVMVYDLTTGTLEPLFTETGYGPLWYGDGGFYLQEKVSGEEWVVWYSLDGTESQQIRAGRLLAVTDSGLVAVATGDEVSGKHIVYTLYRNKEKLRELSPDGYWHFAGLSDAGLFLLRQEQRVLSLWQFSTGEESWRLGVLTELNSDYDYAIAVEDFLATEEEAALVVGYHGGSAFALNEVQAAKARLNSTDTVELLELPDWWNWENLRNGETPQLIVNETGQLCLAHYLPGDLRIHYDVGPAQEQGDLELYGGTTWTTLIVDFAPSWADGIQREPQEMEYIHGKAYMTVATCRLSPEDSQGWRDAYTLLKMDYLEITPGQENVLATVVYDT